MSTWKGPCRALLDTYSNPIARRLHKRASEKKIAYETAKDGLSARVWRVEYNGVEYTLIPLGRVQGGDPMQVFINAALSFTEHDAELFDLIAQDILDRTAEIDQLLRDLLRRVERAADELAAVLP